MVARPHSVLCHTYPYTFFLAPINDLPARAESALEELGHLVELEKRPTQRGLVSKTHMLKVRLEAFLRRLDRVATPL
jgi:hypothetical protein